MTAPPDTPSENPGPDESRLSTLSQALLRISASLDLETVLREVIDGARALTGATQGCIVTFDETGTPQDFVTSGMTEDERRRMEEWPDRLKLFERFRDLPGPLRLSDFRAFVRSLGFTWDLQPFDTGMCTPMHHLGVQVGNFYLADKEGGLEFTDEDEEALLLFAAQGAAAIVNARTVWERESDGPRPDSGAGSQASEPAKPRSRKLPSSWVRRPRVLGPGLRADAARSRLVS